MLSCNPISEVTTDTARSCWIYVWDDSICKRLEEMLKIGSPSPQISLCRSAESLITDLPKLPMLRSDIIEH
jgi:hypothetical protein